MATYGIWKSFTTSCQHSMFTKCNKLKLGQQPAWYGCEAFHFVPCFAQPLPSIDSTIVELYLHSNKETELNYSCCLNWIQLAIGHCMCLPMFAYCPKK